jgi:flavin reductase (DIM6/NTAB) family NADH-FMN oxidoreductase RutF
VSGVHFYEPAKGHGLPHDPFKAIIAPRPIGWISTVDAEGRPNLAPYSFFNAFSSVPPIIGFCSEGWKHSVRNIEATGEFVFNLATAPLAQQMNITGSPFEDGVDEMAAAGLTAAACRLVRAPRVAESPAAMECRLISITQLSDMDGNTLGRFLVLGQVVGVHIDASFLKEGLFDTAAARPLARCGYLADYAEVGELFRMPRTATV